jgi:alcohol dehydrogenase class IV
LKIKKLEEIKMVKAFNFARIPHIIFGAGKIQELKKVIPKYGNNILFVIGGNSLKKSGNWDIIESMMIENSVNYSSISVNSEPSPEIIDRAVSDFRDENLDLVIGIGGGSVTDAGKAISAMIPKTESVKNYLEGIGNKVHDGEKLPYIAIPTTSGTGSEATKNAVISEVGPKGFKKSLRHENLIPNYAIIDPELMLTCPSSISASCGLDAFTQLLEAYVSTKNNPISDALAYSGINLMKDSIIPVCSTDAFNLDHRSNMAYSSLISGITLASAGLGIIHGLASPIGGFFDIPHGVVCGTLLAECTKRNIRKLLKIGSIGREGLEKYANIGSLIAGNKKNNPEENCIALISTLEKWTTQLKINKLGNYGIKEGDIDFIVDKAGLKNNPSHLEKKDIKEILLNRL